jgi:argininosuccinate lyase
LDLTELQRLDPRITADVFEVLAVDKAVESRGSYGGTAPGRVRQAAAAARERFL